MSKTVQAISPRRVKGANCNHTTSGRGAVIKRATPKARSVAAPPEGHEQFRQMIDSLPQLVWTCTPDGRCDYLSRPWVEYTGVPAERQTGLGWLEQIHRDDQPRLIQAWKAAVATGAEFQEEFRIRRHDGVFCWFDTRAVPVRDRAGHIVRWVGSNTDITERRQHERDTAHLAAIVESSFSGIVSKDLHGVITSWNAAAEKILGYTGAEMIGHTIRELIPADRQHEEDEILRKMQRGERVDHMETVRRRKGGRLLDVSITLSPIKNSTGKIIGVSKIVRDITARKRTDRELRASEERFRLMVEGARDYAIVILDAEGRVSAWNTGAERIHGYASEEIIGRHFSSFHTSEDLENRKAERLLAAATAKHRVADEGWLVRKDGSRFWADTVLTARHNEDGTLNGFCQVTRDMTERQELESKFNELQKQELATQLTTGVAHRFNNILCEIMVNSEMALAELKEGDAMRQFLEPIKASGERAARITRQLLAFSPQLTGFPQIFNLAAVVRQMEPALRADLGDAVRLRMHTDDAAGQVNLDPEQVRILIRHLVSNARESMPGGGKCDVQVLRATFADARDLPCPEMPPGDYVGLTITDSGHGMDDEIKSHLFEPFFTTKGPGRDGLGLAVCHSIIKQNGGHVLVRSHPDQGTSVDVYFPAVRTGKSAPSGEAAAAGLPRGTETVLVVDDDDLSRAMVVEFLDALGYVTLQSSNGAEALAKIREDLARPIDMLITDGRMPGLNGRELANEFLAAFPRAQVLFISGFPAEPGGISRLTGFDTATLPKPFTLPELARKLREMFDR